MLKTIALIGLAAALVIPSVPAFAVSGNSSSYGTEGYGPTVANAVADALPALVEPRQREQGARESWRCLGSPSWRLRPPLAPLGFQVSEYSVTLRGYNRTPLTRAVRIERPI